MSSWLRDLLPKKEQMAESETQIVVKRKNLLSLFREDDEADAESRGIARELEDTLIRRGGTANSKSAPSLFESENKLGLVLQVFHLWACGSQSPSSHSDPKNTRDFSRDCYQDAEFSTLVVRHGDCLSEISRLVGIPMEVLQRVNSIANIEHLKPGQNLRIPRKAVSSKHKRFWDDKTKGEKRVIANWGDTLWSLADEHHVSIDDIRRSNNLPPGSSHLYVGQELVIPSPAQPICMTLSQGPPLRYLLRKENLATIPALKPIVQNKIVELILPKWEPEPFGLPCHGGWLSSFYGWKDGRWYFHNGIDIAVERGTEVIASTSGKVTWSGWKGGYGKTVCMDHGNGYITLYAHCDNVHVQPGQFVRKGQVIALSGNTGHSTGPHLHFEIHKDGRTVDPLAHLPPL
ncbi:uncharacterized protein [Physcomitrium patens]|uniref:LysM domain-containing protein n=1 Tax=Physcomitrium patens TaxID=3218 RepID=A0A2K1L2C4_PHYPA|nr:uncharacterized protein LOC112272999 isoform X1 [Physcomitrium patens]PNR60177.1 hypothetical protein PHYPA_002970 [Physcomitrium patens]|eukprot:XP_024357048.1 uncharacterized protein LOC112272999 isoform X1 [Physcomitrella patens]